MLPSEPAQRAWVQNCGGEMMSIHVVRERAAGFYNVKSIAYIALGLVGKVHRLAVGMGSYGVRLVHKLVNELAGE